MSVRHICLSHHLCYSSYKPLAAAPTSLSNLIRQKACNVTEKLESCDKALTPKTPSMNVNISLDKVFSY